MFVVLTALWFVQTSAAQESTYEHWQAVREPASEMREMSDFVWGANDIRQDLSPPFDAHVDGFDPWYPLPRFGHSQIDDPERSIGLGDPLVGTSWRNRPLHVGWLFGGFIGDALTNGQAEQHEDIVGGYRFGWDFDHYWGTEARFAFSNVDFTDASDPTTLRTAKNQYWDINLLYYPWGDARWRPFASLGVGWGDFEYTLADSSMFDKRLLTLPFGIGVKYFFKNWMALRLTATDNLGIGRGPLDTMHNVTLTADVEMHFGGRRTSYFPYSGSIHMW